MKTDKEKVKKVLTLYFKVLESDGVLQPNSVQEHDIDYLAEMILR